jgi:hypothetical protein
MKTTEQIKDEDNRNRPWRGLAWAGLGAALLGMLLWRLYYISPVVRSWDEVDFVLALGRFDLLAMQPHFPGYPYFILGGMLMHTWVKDPAAALIYWNLAITASTVAPIYWLGRRILSPLRSAVLVLLVWTPAYMWVVSAVPMSEAAASAVLWWYVWSLRVAWERRSLWWRWVHPLFWFGVLMGVRLSYAPFGLGLLLLAWRDRKQHPEQYPAAWWKLLLIGVVFQLIWVAALASSEGGLSGLWLLAQGFINGHFNEWGGSAVSSDVPFLTRVRVLFAEHVLWTGLWGRSWGVGLLWCIAAAVLARTKRMTSEPYLLWLSAMLAAYLIWSLLGQNIEKPRHIVPAIGMLSFLFGVAMLRARGTLPLILILLLTATQSWNGAMLSKQQTLEEPAVHQLAKYLTLEAGRSNAFILYTWEETRVLGYAKVGFSHTRIQTFALFQEQLRANPEGKVYITDHVLSGFERQVGSLQHKVKQAASFHSSELFDPVYHQIELYEWIR